MPAWSTGQYPPPPPLPPPLPWSGAIGGTIEDPWAHAPPATVNRMRKHAKRLNIRARISAPSSRPSSCRSHGVPSDGQKSRVSRPSNGPPTHDNFRCAPKVSPPKRVRGGGRSLDAPAHPGGLDIRALCEKGTRPLVSLSNYRLREWVGDASDRAQDWGIPPAEGRAGGQAAPKNRMGWLVRARRRRTTKSLAPGPNGVR